MNGGKRRLKITLPRNLNSPEHLQIHFNMSSKSELLSQCFPYFNKKKRGREKLRKDCLTEQLSLARRQHEFHGRHGKWQPYRVRRTGQQRGCQLPGKAYAQGCLGHRALFYTRDSEETQLSNFHLQDQHSMRVLASK